MPGLKACRAALALAKRGLSVTQGFIFLARGGCGLSLFTSLLATSLGEELHKYFDPCLFYDDEELRKIVELLYGGIVFFWARATTGRFEEKDADALTDEVPFWRLTTRSTALCYTYEDDQVDWLEANRSQLSSGIRRYRRAGI